MILAAFISNQIILCHICNTFQVVVGWEEKMKNDHNAKFIRVENNLKERPQKLVTPCENLQHSKGPLN